MEASIGSLLREDSSLLDYSCRNYFAFTYLVFTFNERTDSLRMGKLYRSRGYALGDAAFSLGVDYETNK